MTSRTVLAYLRNVLDNSWEPSVTGRDQSVPKPVIRVAADSQTTRVSQINHDLVVIADGTGENLTPKSVGWTHREVESTASIIVKTQHSSGRLGGVRDANNDEEEYGGLRGEILRILDLIRKGDKEYDLIDGYEWKDQSEDVGFQFYRGIWEVRLTELAQKIDPPDP